MVNSLYIHIPFCRKKCVYCDFYSIAYNTNLAKDYIGALCVQLGAYKQKFSTIYIGGGTPSILDFDLWEKLLLRLKDNIAQDCEFTIEANPDSLSEDKLKLFLAHGINRVSVGVQSFDDKKLQKLGRAHSAAQAKTALDMVFQAGFKNISCDLIFGVWGDELTGWREDLMQAVSLPVTHISAYALSCEDGTPLSKDVDLNRIELMRDEFSAQLYSFTMQALPRAGFAHYEISNYARPGFECKHNMAYWRNESYLGIGASAAGYVDHVRYKNIDNVKEYIKLANKGNDCTAYKEVLTGEERAKESAAIKIRTSEGIDLDWFKKTTGFNLLELCPDGVAWLVKQKLLEKKDNHLRLTFNGFLFADDVSARLL